MNISFIGTGNMGGAIVRAVCRVVEPESVRIANRSREKAEALAAESGCTVCGSNPDCAEGADVLFIGVKPYGVRELIDEIKPALSEGCLLVSMAAGVSGGDIRETLGGDRRNPIVRILPNTACAIGEGLMLIAPCGDVDAMLLRELEAMLSACGQLGYTDEEHADAAMTIGGCTPAFTYMFIEALADGAVATGIKRADAVAWAARAVAGAAELVLQSGRHPGQLKDEVCSPGGSTIQGVRALEEGGLRAAAMDAVIRAWEKSTTLGK